MSIKRPMLVYKSYTGADDVDVTNWARAFVDHVIAMHLPDLHTRSTTGTPPLPRAS
jgi:hypothetical protein